MATVVKQPAPKKRSDQLRKILAAADVQIEPVRATAGYRFAAILVAAGMLVLPLLYLAIFALFCFALYWHATGNFTALSQWGFFGVVIYILPLIIGPIIIFFLIKPFLARRPHEQKPQRLNPEAEPFLYDFVHALARAVHAPPPVSIRVVCEVNAAAGYRHGLFSMLSNDTVLILGLPLVAGINLQQLAGVIAHELGHLAARGGARATYLISIVLSWFQRAACVRDNWDRWLRAHSHRGNIVLRGCCWVIRFFVWLARWVPWSMTLLGYVLACNLLRQREFDADRYMARLCGDNVVESTMKRSTELGIASTWAWNQIPRFADEGRLTEDLPGLVAANRKYITPEIRKDVRKSMQEEKTGWFDTHPPERERIASARAERARPVFQLADDNDLAASVVFRDFRKLCRLVTLKLYREDFGLRISKRDLHSVKDLLRRYDEERESFKAVHRYFQVRIPPLFPLPLDPSAADEPTDPVEIRTVMKTSRKRMLAALPRYQDLVKKYEKAEGRLFDASCAKALFDVGLRAKRGEFGMEEGTRSEANRNYRRAEDIVSRLAGDMLVFEGAAGKRLSAALQLLQVERVAQRIEGGEDLRYEIGALIPDAVFISELMSDMRDFREFYHRVVLLYSHHDPNSPNVELIEAILDQLQEFHERMGEVDEQLHQRIYPLDHAKADTTLREYAMPHFAYVETIADLLSVAEYLFEQLVKLQVRIFAKLAAAAEKVEDVFKLPRLPLPKQEPEEDEERDE